MIDVLIGPFEGPAFSPSSLNAGWSSFVSRCEPECTLFQAAMPLPSARIYQHSKKVRNFPGN